MICLCSFDCGYGLSSVLKVLVLVLFVRIAGQLVSTPSTCVWLNRSFMLRMSNQAAVCAMMFVPLYTVRMSWPVPLVAPSRRKNLFPEVASRLAGSISGVVGEIVGYFIR